MSSRPSVNRFGWNLIHVWPEPRSQVHNIFCQISQQTAEKRGVRHNFEGKKHQPKFKGRTPLIIDESTLRKLASDLAEKLDSMGDPGMMQKGLARRSSDEISPSMRDVAETNVNKEGLRAAWRNLLPPMLDILCCVLYDVIDNISTALNPKDRACTAFLSC